MDRVEAIKYINSLLPYAKPGEEYESLHMVIAALRAQQGYSPAEQPPPDRFLAQTKWGKVVLVERRSWGDPDWLVGGLYIPKDIVWWWPLPTKEGADHEKK